MAPAGWATDPQTALLKSLLPQYEECQVSRHYKPFWTKLYAVYLKDYPLVEDLFPGFKVSDLDEDQMKTYSAALEKLQSRLREWYRWRCNARSRKVAVSVPKRMLKSIYAPRTRGPKAIEAYSKLFPEEVRSAQEAGTGAGIAGKGKIQSWQAVCTELLSCASDEQLKAIDEYVEKSANDRKSGMSTEDTTPKDQQRYINHLPAVLKSVVEPAVRKAGLMALITLVGPVPDAQGKISAWTLQFGDHDDTPLFSSSWVDHDRLYVEAVARFAKRHVFTSDVCGVRSTNESEEKGEGSSQDPGGTLPQAGLEPLEEPKPVGSTDAQLMSHIPPALSASAILPGDAGLRSAEPDPIAVQSKDHPVESDSTTKSSLPAPQVSEAHGSEEMQSASWTTPSRSGPALRLPTPNYRRDINLNRSISPQQYAYPSEWGLRSGREPSSHDSEVFGMGLRRIDGDVAPSAGGEWATSSASFTSPAPLFSSEPGGPAASPNVFSSSTYPFRPSTPAFSGSGQRTVTSPYRILGRGFDLGGELTDSHSNSRSLLASQSGTLHDLLAPSSSFRDLTRGLAQDSSQNTQSPNDSRGSGSATDVLPSAGSPDGVLAYRPLAQPSTAQTSRFSDLPRSNGCPPPNLPSSHSTPINTEKITPPGPCPAVSNSDVPLSLPPAAAASSVHPPPPPQPPQVPMGLGGGGTAPTNLAAKQSTTISAAPPAIPTPLPLDPPQGPSPVSESPPRNSPAISTHTEQPPQSTSPSPAPEPAPRRSGRGSVPSKKHELAQQIGSNVPRTSLAAKSSDDSLITPEWYSLAIVNLMGRDLGAAWVEMIMQWGVLELALGFGKVSKGSLPVKGRPEEWSQWTTKGARNHDHSPFIDDPAELGLAITSWWRSIQPPFRHSDGPELKPIYEDPSTAGDVWASIRKSGTNGLLSLMMLVFWWGCAAYDGPAPFRDDSRGQWAALVEDITHCLVAMTATAPVRAPKRGAIEPEKTTRRKK
ncbi:hypothetical protein DFP72DRAFT_1076322 [Ephemerocybe angulata]|uniref:Uncharacterized protein n=1 Tax=Ephemerocybe angulata TaxID=980116 RepID=A0A8H6LXJ5_9AGAR|nr:hypothetical protein DFP72DRAFT_1076322 [Tulosesus angulatus]